MLTVSTVVLLSVGLVLGVVVRLCVREKSLMHTHSYQHNEPNIHGNNYMILQKKLWTLLQA
jgi:hypothetical protein